MSTQMTFPVTPDPLYILADGVSSIAIADQLSARQHQLDALLSMTYGEQGTAFRMLSDDVQENFMWACNSLFDEIHQLSQIAQAMAKGVAA